MFYEDLKLGKQNEAVIFKDLGYRGLRITPTEGKHPFDGFLPDGRSVECKLDLRSQARGYAAIEAPTIARHADFYFHTLTYYLVFPGEVYEHLYNTRGFDPKGMGDQHYDGRLIKKFDMKSQGMFGQEFVNSLTQKQ